MESTRTPLVLRDHEDRNSQLTDPRICELVERSQKHDDECPICYTEYAKSPKIVRHTQCRHTFCAGCFIRATRDVHKCPMCRGMMKKSEKLERFLEVFENIHASRRQIKHSFGKILAYLSKIGQKLTELEAKSAESSLLSLFPLLSLRALLDHSQNRVARRIFEYRTSVNRMTVQGLADTSKDLVEACREFEQVYIKLRSGRDDDQSAEQHFSAGFFKLLEQRKVLENVHLLKQA